jgi:hypothetical protein
VVLESIAPDETGITAYFLKSFGVKKLAVTSNKLTTDFAGNLNHAVLEVDVYKNTHFLPQCLSIIVALGPFLFQLNRVYSI